MRYDSAAPLLQAAGGSGGGGGGTKREPEPAAAAGGWGSACGESPAKRPSLGGAAARGGPGSLGSVLARAPVVRQHEGRSCPEGKGSKNPEQRATAEAQSKGFELKHTCAQCRESKPASKFAKNRQAKTVKERICMSCAAVGNDTD